MGKYKFSFYIIAIFVLAITTSSVLYNNSAIVKSENQQNSIIAPVENKENSATNLNSLSNASSALPIGEQKELTNELAIYPTSTPTPTSSLPDFNVSTADYQCTTGDPSIAIQNAINSLPKNRTEPLNVTLHGIFNSVQSVVLEDNINFIGQNAKLIGVNNTNMFVLNQNATIFSEVHKVFKIDGYDGQFVDWVNLHNVTFQSLEFQHPLAPASGDYAIYCFQHNATGWGINDNFNISNCTFNGFYSGFYGLPINSCFENNVFSNYTSNGFMLPYGLNVTIENNTFDTVATSLEVLSYPGDYPTIGLHLLDVNVSCIVRNNTFITDDYSVGLAVVSSTGNITVTNNIFVGNGQPIAVDFYPRPFSTQGLYVYDNTGQPDFSVL